MCKLRCVPVEAAGGQDHFEMHWVQDLLLLQQGLSGGTLEEDTQAALQASAPAQGDPVQHKEGTLGCRA